MSLAASSLHQQPSTVLCSNKSAARSIRTVTHVHTLILMEWECRYMTRNGVWPGVFDPASIGGLNLTEMTLPELLRDKVSQPCSAVRL
jgi:hypothetical protein